MSDSAPPEPKIVGKGVQAPAFHPLDPQAFLKGSNHPYAPFVGNALKWESYVFDDGTTYEGLAREEVPHAKGVLVFGDGLGGGIQATNPMQPKRGDKYEGEFDTGFAHGLGQYTSVDGKSYRGEWAAGKMHGCGAVYDTTPFLQRVDGGMDPDAAWAEAQDEIQRSVQYGTWRRDYMQHSGPDGSGKYCSLEEIRGTLQELDSVVSKARMFAFKPDGEVTFRMAQDAVGMPAPLMQDPMHYPHGTKFMAPGPMGQCFPIPDDDNLKHAMAKHAANHGRIFNSYNFDFVTQPGSDMEKAEKLWRKKEERRRKQALRRKREDEQRMRRIDQRAGGGSGSGDASTSPDVDYTDDDLVATVADFGRTEALRRRDAQQQQQRGFIGGPTVFASLSMSMSSVASQAGALVAQKFRELGNLQRR